MLYGKDHQARPMNNLNRPGNSYQLPNNNYFYGLNEDRETSDRRLFGEYYDVFKAVARSSEHNDEIVRDYARFGWGNATPIPHEIIPDLPYGDVKLSNIIHGFTNALLHHTRTEETEVPFVLLGYAEKGTNHIVLDNFEEDYDKSKSKFDRRSSDQNSIIGNKEKMDRMIEIVEANSQRGDPIVCLGHTHPAVTYFYDTTDLADLYALVDIDSDGEPQRLGGYMRRCSGCPNLQFIQGTIIANGDVNFMFYDKNYQEFFKIPSVRGTYGQRIPSYSLRTPQPHEVRRAAAYRHNPS